MPGGRRTGSRETCDEGEEGSSEAKGNHGHVLGEECDRVFFRSDSGFCRENRSVKARGEAGGGGEEGCFRREAMVPGKRGKMELEGRV